MKSYAALLFMLAALGACRPADAGAGQTGMPSYALTVERVSGEIYNPWTQSLDPVDLRAFRGEGVSGYTAPTLRVSPGQVLRLAIDNRLAVCDPAEAGEHACFNATNIHTHGLWVSPGGNSDNVMVSIGPGERFDYEFAIPETHPAGTFWYHPHMHGATSVQLGSGMAGALIIEGDRVPTASAPGDVDILFSEPGGSGFGEQIWVFSQIQYGCFDADGVLKSPDNPDPNAPPWEQPPWLCEAGDVGVVDNFHQQFGPIREFNSGRLHSINGEIMPTITGVEAGRFQRLRMIHAGLRADLTVKIRQMAEGAPDPRSVPAAEHVDWVNQYCTGDLVEQFQFADDGLTRRAMRTVTAAAFSAGSRFDALAYFEEPGTYCLINDRSWEMQPEEYRVMGLIEVTGASAPVESVTDHLTETLFASASVRIADREVRGAVIADLDDGLKLNAFEWYAPVTDDELTGRQTAQMTINPREGGGATPGFDGMAFEHGRMDRVLTLGDVEEWVLTSNRGRHPFHIHVNPLQVISIIDDDGRDVSVEGSEGYDAEYAAMIGGWRDTVMVERGYTVTVRTRYRRFVGDFVLHCHFASHGDEGMMQHVRVTMPGDRDMAMMSP